MSFPAPRPRSRTRHTARAAAVLAAVLAAATMTLAACARDPLAPAPAAATVAGPAFLLGVGEDAALRADTVTATGTEIMVVEYAAGTYADPARPAAGSVTIRTVIPTTAPSGSSKSCITSTVVRTETRPGWTATVKKPGGCDKEVAVELTNAATRERAQFSFLYIAGKTRIDHGRVR